MHGGLICITFCLSVCPSVCPSVTGPKFRLENNSYLRRYSSQQLETWPQYIRFLYLGHVYRSRSKVKVTMSKNLIFNDIASGFDIWPCDEMSWGSRSKVTGSRSNVTRIKVKSATNNSQLCVIQIPCFHCIMHLTSELKIAQCTHFKCDVIPGSKEMPNV